jgi:hypothetical protein
MLNKDVASLPKLCEKKKKGKEVIFAFPNNPQTISIGQFYPH